MKKKTKTAKSPALLIRSDKNLLAFALFAAALLIGVFVFLDDMLTKPSYKAKHSTETTIRVETVPARVNSESDFIDPDYTNASEYPQEMESGY
jgi:hypothetical protein